ncbi:MAG: antitoxin [Candidatus Omnitrophica bacterium]|nr:antitoxin [Candidatus Omnitrophota bacterium]
MKKIKLTKEEKRVERGLLAGNYRKVTGKLLGEVSKALANRKKDYIMTIRVSSDDIRKIKQKAQRLGVRYQTFISEILHQIAD